MIGHDEVLPEEPEGVGSEPPESVTVATDLEIESAIRQVMDEVPLANRHAICRAALRAGVRLLVGDPAMTVGLLREQRVRVAGARPVPAPSQKGGGQ